MATKLDSEVTRESDILIDGRNIMVSMSSTDGISLRLKGLKDGGRKVGISDLWNMLGGDVVKKPIIIKNRADSEDRYPQPSKKDVKRVLDDIRTHNIISNMTYDDKVKFEAIIKSLMDIYGY